MFLQDRTALLPRNDQDREISSLSDRLASLEWDDWKDMAGLVYDPADEYEKT